MDLYKVAKEKFKLGNQGVANYGWLLSDETLIMCETHVCHAGLRRGNYTDGEFVGIVSQVMGNSGRTINSERRSSLGKDLCIKYYDWLFNRSPLKDCYYTKDAALALKDNFIIINVDQPGNVMMAACISHRYLWEETKVPRAWGSLVEAGVDETGAFMIAHCITAPYHKVDEFELNLWATTISCNSDNSNHTIFGYDGCTAAGLRNFLACKPAGRLDPTYSKYKRVVVGIDELYSGQAPNDPMLTAIIKKCVEQVAPNGKKEAVPANPFALRTPPATVYHYGDLIKFIAESYPQILKECKVE